LKAVPLASRTQHSSNWHFNAGGTFFELPAKNAGGFSRVRAVATHDRRIVDYCSFRGLFIMSGLSVDARESNPHIIRSTDGRTALWVGAVDDVWKLGKPRGVGGPWKNTPAKAGQPSDVYLMSGYDSKVLTVSHSAMAPVNFQVECDITGAGLWAVSQTIEVASGETARYEFPAAMDACWLRVRASADCVSTAQLEYK